MRTRNQIANDAAQLRKSVTKKANENADMFCGPKLFSLLGRIERFEDALCHPALSVANAKIKLTLLRLEASGLNAYQFTRRPSQRWIARYGWWESDT